MKTVLVTGGTTRLGKAISEHLRAQGWQVLTTSHRADSGADILADFTKPDGAARAYAEARRLLGGQAPDALVNNAALFAGDAAMLNAVNLDAPQALTRLMAERTTGRGAVVNILDTRVLSEKSTDFGAYSATKTGLMAATRADAVRFAATLRVNGLAPGPVLAPTAVREKAGEMLVDRPTPADVAYGVAYLLAANATTGAILPVDGGQSLVPRLP